jgi:alpha-glucosidase
MVTRSTFAGSGKYAAHWTGDNMATWEDLSGSITTMNNLALFGIPMVGADICGFLEDTTPELCTRWIQVGAFSPFSRNHNGLYDAPQELYRWASVADASRTVLNLRYRLLPYLYTLMYNAHHKADTVLNAMWMHFPADRTAFFRDGQYMWSNGLLFTPVLIEGATNVEGYFPIGKWYSLFDTTLIDASTGGVMKVLDTPLMDTNAHVRGGTVVPMQEFKMTTSEVKVTPVTLMIALDAVGAATGSLFMDDGDQVEVIVYSEVRYQVTTDANGVITLSSSVLSSLYECPTCTLGAVKVLGISGESCSASLQVGDATIQPSSLFIALAPTETSYSSVTVTFDDTTAVNIFTDHEVTVFCSSGSPSSDDGDDGFTSLPTYAQGLIITTCVIFGIAIIFVASKVAMFKNRPSRGSYCSSNGDAGNHEAGSFNINDPLLVLDEEENP